MEKIKFIFLVVFFIYCFLVFNCSKSYSQLIDIDGNEYKTVKIGNQEWMVENLNVEHFRNGDIIPQVQDEWKWSQLRTGAWCYFKNVVDNGAKFGKLYNWFVVTDSRGLAPEGWHIPTDKDWKILINYLGGDEIAGGKMKSTTLWNSPNEGATNVSGFSALPSTLRDWDGRFGTEGDYCSYWSLSETNSPFQLNNYAYSRSLNNKDATIEYSYKNKRNGLSIRCVKD